MKPLHKEKWIRQWPAVNMEVYDYECSSPNVGFGQDCVVVNEPADS